jgi:hypothetical protein
MPEPGQYVMYVPKGGPLANPFFGIIATVPTPDKATLMVIAAGGWPEGPPNVKVVKQADAQAGEECCWIIPFPKA